MRGETRISAARRLRQAKACWRGGFVTGGLLAACVLQAIVLEGCSAKRQDPSLAPTRGYLLISIDTLRADRLGCYGYSRDTSPFLDSLAARGVLFENAFVQLPGTLPSHMSIFTGLYPAEHNVYPPDGVLSPQIETLPELFQRHGLRTGGFTEGGYVAGRYGFARGFDEFDDRIESRSDDVERTLARGLEFLRRLAPGERFFLFLHTYAVHDPYRPPEPYASQFGVVAPAGAFAPTGPNLSAFNRGDGTVSPAALDYYRAAYDASIRYVDDVLEGFFAQLAGLDVGDLTVVITSDHGEEFLEHHKMAHEQIYRETMNVPLVVLHPQLRPRRASAVVESIDIAPTLIEIAGIESWRRQVSGRSLVDLLLGREAPWATEAYGESFDRRTRTLFRESGEDLFQVLETDHGLGRPHGNQGHGDHGDGDQGTWVTRRIELDAFGSALEFSALSYHRRRRLQVAVDGEIHDRVEIEPRRWTRVAVELPQTAGKKRITLSTDDCDVPRDLGESGDPRCLSFRVRGVPLRKLELYDLRRDPEERHDLSARREAPLREAARRLRSYQLEPVAPAEALELDSELEERLRALGYLQ